MSEPPQTFSHYPAWPAPTNLALTVIPEHECPYLPGRVARSRAMLVSQLPAEVYHQYMDAGFRRSGRLIYQPICRGCRACVPIRVPVGRFLASKSQRRCRRRNADLAVSIGPAVATRETYDLYRRYLRDWHGRQGEEASPESYLSFLYDSPVKAIQFSYRDSAGTLLAIGLCDESDRFLSSVYFYFDPAHSQRRLGTLGVLQEIDYAAARHIPDYYLGYCIDGCASMSYKSGFRPHEILDTDGIWREAR